MTRPNIVAAGLLPSQSYRHESRYDPRQALVHSNLTKKFMFPLSSIDSGWE